MKALVTGGTGLIGKALLKHLPEASVLSRDVDKASKALPVARVFRWDPASGPPSAEAFDGVASVFNLAGEPVAEGRWSAERRRKIRDSRVLGTRNLVRGFGGARRKPSVLVSASAIGYYGDRGDELLEESSPRGSGFLAEVCAEWEEEAFAAEKLGVRVVCVRFGVVLAREGGALAKMIVPFKLGVGGRLGNGRQWMSWVHVDDVVGLLLLASGTETLRGVVNAVAPNPLTNADFTKVLAHAVHRPAFLPLPTAALRLVLGDATEVLTGSQRVVPRVAEGLAYPFEHADLAGALRHVLREPKAPQAKA